MVTVLGIDAGQSGSRLRLQRPGRTDVSWTAAGIPPGMSPLEAITGPLLDSAVGRILEVGLSSPLVVGAGLSGFHGGAAGAKQAHRAWSRALDVRRISLTDDAVTSYLGALGDTSGVVVAAGTGVTVLASDGAASFRVNGWGPTVGDEGSGYWIGQQGLRSAYRWLDGRGGSERLAAEAVATFGELAELPGILAASADRIAMAASFARQVATAAHDGDVTANRIWTEAGKELAESALASLGRIREGATESQEFPVSWNGSLFAAGELLLAPFRNAIEASRADAHLVAPIADSLQGALELTRNDNMTRFGALVDTSEIG